MSIGKVYLVGAGPGDIGLMTIKGMEIMHKADVILYDHLVGDALLAMLPDTAELIQVGKYAGNHTMPQEDINRLLLEKALEGKCVLRLKGGDPFMFGRGGEELELLAEHKVPYEIVPGITSPLAVPAYAGVPVTHRDFTSSLHIITGHRRKGCEDTTPYKALAETGGTLVFLMGVAALPMICENLIKAGMPEKTPAGLFQRGTTAAQKRIVATLATLDEECKKQGVITPAIIVVGDVCKLHEQFAWYEKEPLAGKKIIVTRPKESAGDLADRLRALGAEVLSMPAIRLAPVEEDTAICRALEKLSSYQWIAFTSPAGVRFFFAKMKEERIDLRKLHNVRFAVIGEGTAKELEARGFFADAMPSLYNGEALGELMASVCRKDERILLPRASKGNQEIIEKLRGFSVDDIPLYDTIYQSANILNQTEMIEKDDIDYVIFTSASTVRGFAAANPRLDYKRVKAICIGHQTEKCAEDYGMQTYMAEKATVESLVACVLRTAGA